MPIFGLQWLAGDIGVCWRAIGSHRLGGESRGQNLALGIAAVLGGGWKSAGPCGSACERRAGVVGASDL